MSDKSVRRLFDGFAPKHYNIDLTPDRDSMMLSGSVTISGQKKGRPSKRLVFHQKGLKILAAKITRHDKKGNHELVVKRINHHARYDEVRLHSEQTLFEGSYTVELEYTGKITEPLDGVYPCNFRDGETKKQLIMTQFESHHAREAFPCIDEPEAKATFDLALTTPVGESVIANTPIKKQTEQGGKLKTSFQTTPKMSTYLLAFVFGELEFRETTTKHGVRVRVYATKQHVESTAFALQSAARTLEFYNDYFDIPYPLPKCDLVALPDFASGAMENWGCITFREQTLLVDPKNTSLPMKQLVANVVAHELAHQWFGNLVTMKWWNDLWLNEGFASWMAVFAVDKLYPEWKVWTQFIADDQHQGLKLDALENTHPIEVPIKHPDEIRTIFDAISYEKGAGCIHMLAKYLGERDFRDGLRYYLQKHAYKNAVTTDLWDALTEVSGKPVTDFMSAWTSQAGFPLLRAHAEQNSVHLTQEQFLMNPVNRTPKQQAKTQTLWPVALRANRPIADLMITEEEHLSFRGGDKPLVINSEHSGFYRVAYNASHLEALANSIAQGELSPLDRLGILSDVFECAKAGYSGTAEALTLLEAFKNETNPVVWEVIAGNLSAIRSVMDDEQLRQSMKPYILKLIKRELERLGWEPQPYESHFDKLLRPTILGLAAVADEPSVINEIRNRYKAMKSAEDLAPDLRSVILTTIGRLGTASDFERMLSMHNSSNSSEARITLCAALTNFRKKAIVDKALSVIKSNDVRTQDLMYWIAYSFSNRFARTQTWDWLVQNWPWLKAKVGTDLSFYRMPLYVARSMTQPGFLKTYQRFFASVHQPVLDRSIKQGVEIIQWQSAWQKRDLKSIKLFFEGTK